MIVDILNEYVQITRRALGEAALQVSRSLLWGYGYCQTKADLELVEYAKAFEILRNQQLTGEVCLCDDEIEILKSNVHRILGPECSVVSKDFVKEDNPNKNSWILQNPLCQSYEFFADYMSAQCNRLGINFSIVEKKCSDVNVEIKITDHIICGAVDLALSIEEQRCDFNLIPTITIQDCLIELIPIINELKCDVDIETYVRARNCGASLSTVVKELTCAVDLKLDANSILTSLCP